jgi:hypothetical protein
METNNQQFDLSIHAKDFYTNSLCSSAERIGTKEIENMESIILRR